MSRLPHSNEEYKLLHPEEEEPTDEKRTEDISPSQEAFEVLENLSGASKIDWGKTLDEATNPSTYGRPIMRPSSGEVIIREERLLNNKMITYESSLTVSAPERICDIYFATGIDWYGRYRMLGDDTVYQKFDEETDLSEYAWTYTLYTVPDGNAEVEYCSASDFQNIA